MTSEKELKVGKRTRASKYDGRLIHCPKCDMPTKVYHFSWSAITCWKCKDMIDKEEWYLENYIKRRKNLTKC
jgi:ribosomal protein S27E